MGRVWGGASLPENFVFYLDMACFGGFWDTKLKLKVFFITETYKNAQGIRVINDGCDEEKRTASCHTE